MQYTKPSLADYGIGRLAIGGLSTRRRARSDQQQAAFDLRDAQNIFASEPSLLGGIWLPDLRMMAQDSAGTTAAASGAVVGLVYDQSKGMSLGPELVTNGNFSDGTTGWTANDAELSIVDGKLNIKTGVDYGRAFQAVSVVAGKSYIVKCTITYVAVNSGTSVAFSADLINGSGAPISGGDSIDYGPRVAQFIFTAQTTGTIAIRLQNNSVAANAENRFSNVTMREVIGTHAIQATTANKPTLVRFQNDKYWFTPNSTTTDLTATFPSSLGSTCTIFEVGINGVVKRTNQTIATTYNLADKPWFGSIVLNRATTPYEDALFTRLLSRYSPKYQYNDTLSGWLFQSQEKGLILDCDDLPLMFQDASGVTPVTAMEQPVRLILDKSPNHVFARSESDAARPVVSARYNILLATETLSTQNVTTLAATYTLSFSGTGTITLSGTATGTLSAGSNSVTCTAGTLTLTVSGTVTQADLRVTNDGVNLPSYQRVTTATDYDTAGFPRYLLWNGSSSAMVTPSIDFGAGAGNAPLGGEAISNSGGPFTTTTGWSPTSATQLSVVSGCLRVTTATSNYGGANLDFTVPVGWIKVTVSKSDGTGAAAVSIGTPAAYNKYIGVSQLSTFYVYTTDTNMRVALHNGSNINGVYADFFSVSVKPLLDSSFSPDKMTVWVGQCKTKVALDYGLIVALGINNGTTNGVFELYGPRTYTSSDAEYAALSRGTAAAGAVSAANYPSPDKRVLTGVGDIANKIAQLRINGSVQSSSSGSQGTGNYGNYPMYIGARNSASIFFKGRIYSLIVRGAQTSDGLIAAVEQDVNSKTRAY